MTDAGDEETVGYVVTRHSASGAIDAIPVHRAGEETVVGDGDVTLPSSTEIVTAFGALAEEGYD